LCAWWTILHQRNPEEDGQYKPQTGPSYTVPFLRTV
jgi:hypothetical protein